MSSNRRGLGELQELILALFYRKKLTGELRPTARHVSQELGVHYNYDSRVQGNIRSYVKDGWLSEFPAETDDGSPTFEITKDGAFRLWDSLVASERLDRLPKANAAILHEYTATRQRAAEELVESWFAEWDRKRKAIAIRTTNMLVSSAP